MYRPLMGLARQKAIESIKKKGGTIRTHEALAEGIHRRTFYGLRDEGVLVTISRGLYQLADLKAPSSIVSDRLVELIMSMPALIMFLYREP